MRGAVVDDPEHPRSGSIRLVVHDLVDQLVEGGDAGCWRAVTEQLGMAHVPGREVTESTATFVLMLYAHRLTRARAAWDMLALARLDARLLVGTDDQVVGVQWFPAPPSLVQIKHRPGLLFKPRVPWEDPAAQLPGPNGILVEPPPDGGATDLGDDAPADSFGGDFRVGVARQWQAALARQLTGERLDLDDDVRGEKRTVVRVGHDPASRGHADQRTACATC